MDAFSRVSEWVSEWNFGEISVDSDSQVNRPRSQTKTLCNNLKSLTGLISANRSLRKRFKALGPLRGGWKQSVCLTIGHYLEYQLYRYLRSISSNQSVRTRRPPWRWHVAVRWIFLVRLPPAGEEGSVSVEPNSDVNVEPWLINNDSPSPSLHKILCLRFIQTQRPPAPQVLNFALIFKAHQVTTNSERAARKIVPFKKMKVLLLHYCSTWYKCLLNTVER